MGKTEKCELTVLCLLRRDHQILMQNRVKRDWQGYTLPGGHVEPDESIVDAVIREVKEETGLTVENPRLCGIKQFPTGDGRYLVFLFCADRYHGELSSSEEGEMEWIDREKIAQYPCVNDLAELLLVMENEELTEFRYFVDEGQWKVSLR